MYVRHFYLSYTCTLSSNAIVYLIMVLLCLTNFLRSLIISHPCTCKTNCLKCGSLRVYNIIILHMYDILSHPLVDEEGWELDSPSGEDGSVPWTLPFREAGSTDANRLCHSAQQGEHLCTAVQ